MKLSAVTALAILLLLIGFAAPAFADYLALSDVEMTAQSDVIARVRVLATRRNPLRIKDSGEFSVRAQDIYYVATVEVVEGFYGARLDPVFQRWRGVPERLVPRRRELHRFSRAREEPATDHQL